MKYTNTILIVDDEPVGRSALLGLLGPEEYNLQFASDGPSALTKAGEVLPDLILLDVMMPGMDGFEVTRLIRAEPVLAEVPILLVTALDDRSSRLAGIEAGADDFITKPFDRAEMRARIRTILRLNRFRRLHQERENYQHLFEHAPFGLSVTDEHTTLLEANRVARCLFNRWSGPSTGRCLANLLAPADAEQLLRVLQEVSANPTAGSHVEFQVQTTPPAWVEIIVSRASHFGGSTFLIALIDRTSERQLENQLRQAQKMECVGRLASGVAHDFNNLLTVINGFSSIALDMLDKGDQLRDMITQVYQAGERAATLTRQLLAFSRKGMVAPVELDLNRVISGLEKTLCRLIGEHINVQIDPAPILDHIKADPGHIEQILINLAVNARDAMPTGGNLTIATQYLPPEKDVVESSTGWCRLTVSDTGCGMNEEVQAHVFEPFFTTKEVGKGTGLGLATVDGIVRQCGGRIRVFSEVGKGTRFDIDFPCFTSGGKTYEPVPEGKPARGGNETILLAEDQEEVRRFAAAALESAGYTVLSARDGEDALQLVEGHTGPLHLLLTDTVMPRMAGRELAERLKKLRPDIKLLYSSGYNEDEFLLRGVREGREAFLQKPFSVIKLLSEVREVLDR